MRLGQPYAALTLLLLALWQGLVMLHVLPPQAIPAPLTILHQAWADRALYADALPATLQSVGAGVVIGESAAILVAIACIFSQASELALRGIGIVLYALPPLVLTPLLTVLLRGAQPQVILAAIGVYFPVLSATLVGLRQIDPRCADLIALYGGGKFALLRHVRLFAAMPTLLAGLRMAAPAAVLGAMLGEFGGGRPGLGALLLSTMGAGNPARAWGVALVATLLSVLLYALFSIGSARLRRTAVPSLLALSSGLRARGAATTHPARLVAGTLASAAIPLVIWQVAPALFGISPILMRTPSGVMRYLLAGPDAAEARQTLLTALMQTLPLSLAGLAGGLGCALVAALLVSLNKQAERLVMPPLLFLQSVPLVVLIPAIVLVAGRGMGATLLVACLVTFFPAMIVLMEGILLVPRAPIDLLRLYGAGRFAFARHVTLPAALPFLCAAARIVAPSALLGVMVAEWLATGTGMGDLLNEARSTLDYGMIWSVALVTVVLSTGFYVAVEAAESLLLQRRAGGGSVLKKASLSSFSNIRKAIGP
jgi:ABC-type nitrate/sulfonate/bicarbonate transport system permease component